MKKPIYQNLTVQVLTAIAIGAFIGWRRPDWGQALQPLGDAFIRLVKMVVGPIIFLTIVVGIASMGDLKKAGRVGAKALIYFEVVTTLALAVGLIVANLIQPGLGVARPESKSPVAVAAASQPDSPPTAGSADAGKAAGYAQEARKHSTKDFLLHVIPDNIVGAFANGDLLQILFFAVVFGVAVAALGPRGTRLLTGMEDLIQVMFRIVALIMKVAPLGALGAMAFTVGSSGIKVLLPLAKLMGCVYLTMGIFIFVVLGTVCRVFGLSLWRYLVFIREEVLLVLGTSSSESALPRMIEKLEVMGCSRGVVGMVIPAGYSFNLDGTSIYLSMAVLFIAQMYGVHMSLGQQIYVMAILMLTSKGAAAVTGGGFVTLAATLTATGVLPVEGLTILLGVDRFMSEARAITNLIGNGIATLVVSKLEGEFDPVRYRQAMRGEPVTLDKDAGEVLADLGSNQGG
jgi:aerobic C4-dicarboxylate transport protein